MVQCCELLWSKSIAATRSEVVFQTANHLATFRPLQTLLGGRVAGDFTASSALLTPPSQECLQIAECCRSLLSLPTSLALLPGAYLTLLATQIPLLMSR